MPATSDCKPWCTDHQEPNECFTQRWILDGDEKETPAVSVPEPGSLAAQFQALGGLPEDVATIVLIASQDEEDDQPLMHLEFRKAGNHEAVAALHLDRDELAETHKNLGSMLRDLA